MKTHFTIQRFRIIRGHVCRRFWKFACLKTALIAVALVPKEAFAQDAAIPSAATALPSESALSLQYLSDNTVALIASYGVAASLVVLALMEYGHSRREQLRQARLSRFWNLREAWKSPCLFYPEADCEIAD